MRDQVEGVEGILLPRSCRCKIWAECRGWRREVAARLVWLRRLTSGQLCRVRAARCSPREAALWSQRGDTAFSQGAKNLSLVWSAS